MNPARPPLAALRLAFRLGHSLRKMLPVQTSKAFGAQRMSNGPKSSFGSVKLKFKSS